MDTIAVRGPVDAVAVRGLSRQRYQRVVDERTGAVIERMTSAQGNLAAPFRVFVESWRTGDPEVRLEFSVPRVLRGDNRRPATPEEVVNAVAWAYEEVGGELPWLCGPTELEVARIDLTRDFEEVPDGPLLLDALWAVPASRMQTHAYRSRDSRGAQTVVRQTRRQSGKLYIRAARYLEQLLRAPDEDRLALQQLAASEEGVVRFELELRREQAEREGVGVVGHLPHAPLADMARRYFRDRCRFGEPIAGPDWKVASAVRRARSENRHGHFVTAVGQLMADAWGVESGRHEKTVAGYRAEYRRLGLAVADVLNPSRVPVRFDFDLGRVVQVAG